MKERCYNKNVLAYPNYGGRGINVCNQWLNDVAQFHRDMGDVPEGMTLDRINNDAGYSPENCKWSTKSEQQHNRRIHKLNTTGVTGVIVNSKRNSAYISRIDVNRVCINLYSGRDFFEACCARMSANNKYKGEH